MAKLTLSVDSRVVSRAKQYAKLRAVSVSEMVEAYLGAVAEPSSPATWPLRLLRSVRGVLKNADIDAYRKRFRRRNIDEVNPLRYQCHTGRAARSAALCGGKRGGLDRRRDRHLGRDAGRSRGDDDSLPCPKRDGQREDQADYLGDSESFWCSRRRCRSRPGGAAIAFFGL